AVDDLDRERRSPRSTRHAGPDAIAARIVFERELRQILFAQLLRGRGQRRIRRRSSTRKPDAGEVRTIRLLRRAYRHQRRRDDGEDELPRPRAAPIRHSIPPSYSASRTAVSPRRTPSARRSQAPRPARNSEPAADRKANRVELDNSEEASGN